MRRLARLGRGIGLLVVLGLVVGVPVVAGAVEIAINNGLAPPNPANVIDDDIYRTDYEFVWVRNTGCGIPLPWSTCD